MADDDLSAFADAGAAPDEDPFGLGGGDQQDNGFGLMGQSNEDGPFASPGPAETNYEDVFGLGGDSPVEGGDIGFGAGDAMGFEAGGDAGDAMGFGAGDAMGFGGDAGDDMGFGASPVAADEDVEDVFGAGAPQASNQGISLEVPIIDDVNDSKLREWEQKRRVELDERRAEAEAQKAAALETAQSDLAEFYAKRDERLARRKETNRDDEKNFRSDMEQTMQFGTPWEKVDKLVKNQPKTESGGTDRMRKLLIQLKQDKSQEEKS